MNPPLQNSDDILDLRLYNFVHNQIKDHLSLYNFTEVITSNLNSDPMASMLQAYIKHNVNQTPWKIFSQEPSLENKLHNMQTTIGMIHTENIVHDAYFLKMLTSIFDDVFKLEHYVLKLNFVECPHGGCNECATQLHQLTTLLQLLSVNYMIDKSINSNDGYYTKTVFQCSSREGGTLRVFCNGGRICTKTNFEAAQEISSIGATIDSKSLVALVEQNSQKLPLPQAPALHIIIPTTEDQIPLALMLAYELQSHHYATDVILKKAPLPTLVNKANKMGAKFVLCLGPEEQQHGTVFIHHMIRGETLTIKQHEIISFLRS